MNKNAVVGGIGGGSKGLAHEKRPKAPEGAAAGIGAEVMAGSALGWLAGIGALGLPHLEPLRAASASIGAPARAGKQDIAEVPADLAVRE